MDKDTVRDTNTDRDTDRDTGTRTVKWKGTQTGTGAQT
jgi:hypothetical protein